MIDPISLALAFKAVPKKGKTPAAKPEVLKNDLLLLLITLNIPKYTLKNQIIVEKSF